MAGGEVEPDAFENPTEDFEVCFVAGTQVLLADGSTKPIEQIRPGDKVLSSHHLTPEETPTSANVVRFFDNGEKEVVRLRFAAQETPIDATSQLAHDAASPQEIVCTPGHRFYVVGKGWVRAQDLQPGDLALSATGEKIAFVSRENLAEKRRVYNFEVEGKHTYFVLDNRSSFLVHNECPICHGTGIRTVVTGGGMSGAFLAEVPCYCQTYKYYPRACCHNLAFPLRNRCEYSIMRV